MIGEVSDSSKLENKQHNSRRFFEAKGGLRRPEEAKGEAGGKGRDAKQTGPPSRCLIFKAPAATTE